MTSRIAPASATTAVKTARMKPCCLALVDNDLRSMAADAETRRWRVLSLEDRSELASGAIKAGMDESLAIVRDKAATAARAIGYEPQEYVLEAATPRGDTRV